MAMIITSNDTIDISLILYRTINWWVLVHILSCIQVLVQIFEQILYWSDNNDSNVSTFRFEFSDELDLNNFIDEEDEKDNYTYLLYAVLVHKTARIGGGHYVVYINTSISTNNIAPSQQNVTFEIWMNFLLSSSMIFSGVSLMTILYHKQYIIRAFEKSIWKGKREWYAKAGTTTKDTSFRFEFFAEHLSLFISPPP